MPFKRAYNNPFSSKKKTQTNKKSLFFPSDWAVFTESNRWDFGWRSFIFRHAFLWETFPRHSALSLCVYFYFHALFLICLIFFFLSSKFWSVLIYVLCMSPLYIQTRLLFLKFAEMMLFCFLNFVLLILWHFGCSWWFLSSESFSFVRNTSYQSFLCTCL